MFKHIKNLILIFSLWIIKFTAIILGFFILPIALNFRKPCVVENASSNPAECFKWDWVNYIYSNWDDGINGDIFFKDRWGEPTYISRLVWSMLRNPANNLSRRMGVNHKRIVKSIIYGNPYVEDTPSPTFKHDGFKFQEVWDEDGRYYPMYYFIFSWKRLLKIDTNRGIILKLGWKNFNVEPNETDFTKIYDYSFTVAFTPFKEFT